MVQQAEVRSVAVPYLPAIQIECEAESLLVAFGRRFLPIVEPPVPAAAIARELLGLRIEASDLKRTFANPDVHGAIWFRDRKMGSYRKAADLLSERVGQVVSKDQVARAVARSGGAAEVLRSADSDSLVRSGGSVRDHHGRKLIAAVAGD